MMAGEIDRIVLSLPIWVVGGLASDARAATSGALAMGVGVLDPDHHRAGPDLPTRFDQDDSAIARVELRAMVGDPKAQREAESAAEPVDRLADVRVREL